MSYFSSAFDNRKETVETLVTMLKGIAFDTIVCRGVSGLVIAPIVAYQLNKPLTVIRKRDGSHAGSDTEGHYNFQDYIILDDFVATGKTVNTILRKIKKHHVNTRLVGVYTYQSGRSNTGEDLADKISIYDCSFTDEKDRGSWYDDNERRWGIQGKKISNNDFLRRLERAKM